MSPTSELTATLTPEVLDGVATLDLSLPDPEDDRLSEAEFIQRVDAAWLVCDRFDLQSDIWRGRILRLIRDREKLNGGGRGQGFLHWLREREIGKSQAYRWIELADSADRLLTDGQLEPESIERFSKRAFVETAQAAPEVQQMVAEAAQRGDRITRREVRQLSDEWTAMTSDLLPAEVRAKAAENVIPTRYLAPLVREMEKLPEEHQHTISTEVARNPDLETLKEATASARYLSKYIESAARVQALTGADVNLETALDESLRIGCLNQTADLVNQAAQLEQAIAKVYTTWKRLGNLADKLDGQSGASTPHLRSLLENLDNLASSTLAIQLGLSDAARTIRLHIEED
ncbi:hypothetical protein [Synechococcus sp. PCC 7336]|uniref:hypothetical protein n=1 Tax=Synechococcus sp. PCC 7336 TaxID=195250 RepID=UPI000381D38B|nr:hypothetical protein [Synechococcus sp. PCC 7336]